MKNICLCFLILFIVVLSSYSIKTNKFEEKNSIRCTTNCNCNKANCSDSDTCTSITNSEVCLENSNCGWCKDKKTCVSGSLKGPKDSNSCSKEKFYFGQVNEKNAVDTNEIHIEHGGMFVKTEHPDLSNISV